MSEVTTLAEALPAQIKRVQEKRERWLEYERMSSSPAMFFGPALGLMKASINEGLAALASGDVARMMRAHEALADFSDDD